MKKYAAIIFDLFDTIVNFNFKNLPYMDKNGVRSRTTSKEVYEVFKKYNPAVSFDDFYPPFIQSYHLFQEMKKRENREFSNRERFIMMLDLMNLPPEERTDALADEMVTAHMRGLVSCVEFPAANKEVLKLAHGKGYRLAIVSNFDYAPTAHALIERLGIRQLFESVVISEEVGWRKPKDIIFLKALTELSINPADALFIGDNYDADIAGSNAVGMDGVWINRNKAAEDNLDPEPAYIVSRLPEIDNFI